MENENLFNLLSEINSRDIERNPTPEQIFRAGAAAYGVLAERTEAYIERFLNAEHRESARAIANEIMNGKNSSAEHAVSPSELETFINELLGIAEHPTAETATDKEKEAM